MRKKCSGQKKTILWAIFFSWIYFSAQNACAENNQQETSKNTEEIHKLFWTNQAWGSGLILGWGMWQWNYFQRTPHMAQEGWFGAQTKEAGADKFGHLTSTYFLGRAFAWQFRREQVDEKRAAFYGALSSFSLMGLMELGDSFSAYGFSLEDFYFNSFGALLAFFLSSYPSWSRLIDIRVEYYPWFQKADFFTDYQHMKYLMALQVDGIIALQEHWSRYFELQVGYFVRGENNKKRYAYVGIGLNLQVLLDKVWRSDKNEWVDFFNYFNAPYTHGDRAHNF